MNSLGNIKTITKREFWLFFLAGGLCFHRHFSAVERIFHLHGRRIF